MPGSDLREGRLVALAVGFGAERDRDRAVRREADLGAFVGRPARGLEETADADAAQPAPHLRGRAPRLESFHIGTHHGGIEIDRKSTRLNSSHSQISYAVFCLKKSPRQVAGECVASPVPVKQAARPPIVTS